MDNPIFIAEPYGLAVVDPGVDWLEYLWSPPTDVEDPAAPTLARASKSRARCESSDGFDDIISGEGVYAGLDLLALGSLAYMRWTSALSARDTRL